MNERRRMATYARAGDGDEVVQQDDDELLSTAEVDSLLSLPSEGFERQLTRKRVRFPRFWRSQLPLPEWPERRLIALRKSAAMIQMFATDVSASGGELVLVYVPHPWQVGPFECSVGRRYYSIEPGALLPASSGTQEFLRGLAEDLGLVYLENPLELP